ncbi:uncharacterized protein BDZ99DRAFT_532898 [Mytilinidion resinicola]|uniref:Uncharacterized protein n=1 Tax=Mytilinidion resinicola TaxID=574789 RepID=A0A6A6YJT7_9PEZI|nr:uncharacterized protein BDZ99DRAFT_532898 [Mytilinidion resinicola]KAF2808818.1 hypothetical protein BDZ99DRAFT_532898 [Mytilinidion resinicola]
MPQQSTTTTTQDIPEEKNSNYIACLDYLSNEQLKALQHMFYGDYDQKDALWLACSILDVPGVKKLADRFISDREEAALRFMVKEDTEAGMLVPGNEPFLFCADSLSPPELEALQYMVYGPYGHKFELQLAFASQDIGAVKTLVQQFIDDSEWADEKSKELVASRGI